MNIFVFYRNYSMWILCVYKGIILCCAYGRETLYLKCYEHQLFDVLIFGRRLIIRGLGYKFSLILIRSRYSFRVRYQWLIAGCRHSLCWLKTCIDNACCSRKTICLLKIYTGRFFDFIYKIKTLFTKYSRRSGVKECSRDIIWWLNHKISR